MMSRFPWLIGLRTKLNIRGFALVQKKKEELFSIMDRLEDGEDEREVD